MSDEYLMNRLANCTNPYQGKTKKVLCVCSAGLLRSPTAALVLSQDPFEYNTRAAGLTKEFALIPVDDVLLAWADEIVCMSEEQKDTLEMMLKKLTQKSGLFTQKHVINLNIPDNYSYRDVYLQQLIRSQYERQLLERDQNG